MEAFYKIISQAVIPLHHVTDHNSAQICPKLPFLRGGTFFGAFSSC